MLWLFPFLLVERDSISSLPRSNYRRKEGHLIDNNEIGEIIVVDDDPAYLWTLKRELSKAGFTSISTFEDPTEALAFMQNSSRPAFIVSDFKMPGLNGLEFLRKVEALFPGINAVLVSGEPSCALQEKHRFQVLEKTADIGRKVVEIIQKLFSRRVCPLELNHAKEKLRREIDEFRVMHVLQNIEHIGTHPQISASLFRHINDPDFTIEQIVHAIASDPSIAAQVLKTANSVHYSQGMRIDTLTNAVIYLGVDIIRKIVFAIELIGLFKNRQPRSDSLDDAKFWKHTMAGAILAQELCYCNKIEEVEKVFLSALLRNIGVLVIRQHFPDAFVEMESCVSANRISFRAAGKRVCGLDHREIGYLLGVRWNLPDYLVFALRDNHTGREEIQMIRDIISISDTILHQREFASWDPHFSDLAESCLLEKYKATDPVPLLKVVEEEVVEMSRGIAFS